MNGDYPPEDSDRTWHVHENSSWDWDIVCDVCRGNPTGDRYAGTAPMINIRHLKRQNRDGTTTASEEREALGDRWNDETVGRAK